MKKVTFDELREIEADLLYSFDDICRNQGFRYSLGGGSLLGAIRHHGFIPWDDDVDVMMPRKDYQSFLKYCKESSVPFRVIDNGSDVDYLNLFAKIEAINTFTDNHSNNKRYGINIDVFPLDGLGDSYKEAKKNFNKTSFQRELLNACKWKSFSRSKTHSLYLEPIRLFFFLISRFTNPQKLINRIEKQMQKDDFDDSTWAGCICGSYRVKEIVPRIELSEYDDVQFENHMLRALRNYKRYLTQHYGDYMKLPPKEKQITHHTFDAYLLEIGDAGYVDLTNRA